MDNKHFNVTVILLFIATVCCETEKPIENLCQSGTCVNIKNCNYALSFVGKDRATLKQIHCGYEGIDPKVCCTQKDSPILYKQNEEAATNRPTTSTLKPIFTTNTPQVQIHNEGGETFRIQTQTQSETNETLKPQIQSKNKTVDVFPSREICGKINGVTDRIVGGSVAEVGEHPWLALMLYESRGSVRALCSAVLITDLYLLTAAHCVTTRRPFTVRLGEWNTKTELDCRNEICNDKHIDANISEIIAYPTNVLNSADGDIALIRLEEPVTFTDFIQPICLPTSKYIAKQDYVVDSEYWTAGWGATEFEMESSVKRKLQLKAVPMEICQSIYKINPEAVPNIICAGGRKGKDTCRGDSGGPLIKLVPENYELNWYLFGLVSTGTRICGEEGSPGQYTRVSSYMDWIQQKIAHSSVIDS